jgi:hypothetical protein
MRGYSSDWKHRGCSIESCNFGENHGWLAGDGATVDFLNLGVASCTTRRISIVECNETSLGFTYCHHLKETACDPLG